MTKIIVYSPRTKGFYHITSKNTYTKKRYWEFSNINYTFKEYYLK